MRGRCQGTTETTNRSFGLGRKGSTVKVVGPVDGGPVG